MDDMNEVINEKFSLELVETSNALRDDVTLTTDNSLNMANTHRKTLQLEMAYISA
jgi:hypothetical protein